MDEVSRVIILESLARIEVNQARLEHNHSSLVDGAYSLLKARQDDLNADILGRIDRLVDTLTKLQTDIVRLRESQNAPRQYLPTRKED